MPPTVFGKKKSLTFSLHRDLHLCSVQELKQRARSLKETGGSSEDAEYGNVCIELQKRGFSVEEEVGERTGVKNNALAAKHCWGQS